MSRVRGSPRSACTSVAAAIDVVVKPFVAHKLAAAEGPFVPWLLDVAELQLQLLAVVAAFVGPAAAEVPVLGLGPELVGPF